MVVVSALRSKPYQSLLELEQAGFPLSAKLLSVEKLRQIVSEVDLYNEEANHPGETLLNAHPY